MKQRNNISLRFAVFAALMLSGSGACAPTATHKIDFNPSEPLRVMVLPFVQIGEKGEFIEPSPGLFIDAVPLVSAKLEDTPAELVRRLAYSELSATSLEVLAPYLVNVELPHYGFAKSDGAFDLQKIYAATPSELCRAVFDCDAVLYGRIIEWKRAYYGIESVNAVALDLKLVSARSGKVLFSASGRDEERRGLSGGPTGFADIVIEPVKGLDSGIITSISRRLVKRLLSPLNVKQRAPAADAPTPAIYASANDRLAGSLERGAHLTVLAIATENNAAAFSIGSEIRNIPMSEVEPGFYFGEYHPLASDSFSDQPVTVTVTDQFGRTTSQLITAKPLSLH